MSRVEGNTRRTQLLVLTPVCLSGARTSTLRQCQKHLKKRWMTTVASGHPKQRRVMRNQSFLLTGNDISVYMVCAEGKSIVRPFPTPPAAPWVPDSSRREGSEIEGHLASSKDSRTDWSK